MTWCGHTETAQILGYSYFVTLLPPLSSSKQNCNCYIQNSAAMENFLFSLTQIQHKNFNSSVK